jgi:hypothetical protein
MEIQKIFSEIDADERIYSVLLSEEELALFSEIKKEEMSEEDYNKVDNKIAKKALKGLGGSVSGVGLAALAHKKYFDHLAKSSVGKIVKEKELAKLLKKQAKTDKRVALGAGLASLGSTAYAGKQLYDINKLEKTPGYKEKYEEKLNRLKRK